MAWRALPYFLVVAEGSHRNMRVEQVSSVQTPALGSSGCVPCLPRLAFSIPLSRLYTPEFTKGFKWGPQPFSPSFSFSSSLRGASDRQGEVWSSVTPAFLVPSHLS